MTSVATFEAELTQMHALLNQQRSILSGEAYTRVQAMQCAAFRGKITRIAQIDTATVGHLTSVITAGPWTGEQQGELALALSERLIECRPKQGTARPSQEIRGMQTWFDERDALVVSDKSLPWMARSAQAISRMGRMGLIRASETSKQHIFGVLLALYGHGMTTQEIRAEFKKFSDAVKRHFQKHLRSRRHGIHPVLSR